MFHLRKWYLDCTTAGGDAFILYWARARWGAFSVSYASLITLVTNASNTHTQSTLRSGEEPTRNDTEIHWSCPALNLRGRWASLSPGIERTLLQSEGGSVRWSCLMPRASCSLTLDNRPVEGLGYAEVLEVTIAPWRLPIKELRWGRWLSADGSLSWIDWRGPHPLSLIVDGGVEAAGAVTDDAVTLHDGRRLTLNSKRIIRDGELGATVLNAVPGLNRAVPPALLRTHEQKWLARGDLAPTGANGWAIYERIVFGD